jgi:outer membrane protein
MLVECVSRSLFLLFSIAISSAGSFAAERQAQRPTLRLTLEKSIELALARNFTLEVQRFEPEIAQERVTQELGRFDPRFNLAIERAEDTQRSAFDGVSHFALTDISRTDRLSAGIGGTTAWGMDYNLGFGTTNRTGTFNQFDEFFTSEAAFSLRQPLLRDAGTAANLAQLRIARNNVMVSEWQLRQRIIDIITETVAAYNNLQQSIENLRVARGFRDLALQLVADNSRRVEIGVMSPLNVTTARAEAAAREENVIVAQRRIKDNENFLKQLITRDIESLLDIRLEIAPPTVPSFSANVPAGIDQALALRPDYKQVLLEIERRNISLAFTKNQALPRLDLESSLRLLGFENDLGSSVNRVPRRDRTAWTVGAIFSVPIPNREGRGAVVAAKLSAAQSLVNLQRLEQQIVVDVDNANGAVTTARQRIESTQEAYRLAIESLDAGQERLRAGTGTTFEVLELQRNLAEAEFAQLRARTDYNKAVSEYHRQVGSTLQVHQVIIDDPAR